MTAHCKCNHPITTHLGGAGVCTVIGCACDQYMPAVRAVSAEAQQLADDICRSGTSPQAIAAGVQSLIDARISWEREAAELLAQRDYAERRAKDAERKLATVIDTVTGQLHGWLDRHDSGMPAPSSAAMRRLISHLEALP